MSDPAISVRGFDDPDSRRLLKGLSVLFWPGPALLIAAVLIASIFHLWAWALRPMVLWFGFWVAAHLVLRPKRFGADLLKAIKGVRDVFAALSKVMADAGAPLVAKLNKAARAQNEPAPAPHAFMAGLADPHLDPVAASVAPTAPASAPAPRKRIDWMGFVDGLLKFWWIIPFAVSAWALLRLGQPLLNWINGPTGREVVAEARADVAEAEQRTSAAEADQSAHAVVIVEQRGARVDRIQRETEQAREAIQAAPDLDARIAVHDDFTRRMRDDAARARAAALQDYNSSVAP